MASSAFLWCQRVPAAAAVSSGTAQPGSPFVLRVTTREVVVDVIAVDGHQRTVTDLQSRDFEVFDRAAGADAVAQTVSNLRLFDPATDTPGEPSQSGFRIAANESCLQRNSLH